MTGFRTIALVALGANLDSHVGGPTETLICAIGALCDSSRQLQAVSRFYSTPCFPVGAGPDYVNAVVLMGTNLSATAFLDGLHDVEANFGRMRAQRWGQRTLDLDVIAFGDTVLPDESTQTEWRNLAHEAQIEAVPGELILPHPRVQDRGFVLVPLLDVAPDWVHPVTGQTATEMLAALAPDEIAQIRPL